MMVQLDQVAPGAARRRTKLRDPVSCEIFSIDPNNGDKKNPKHFITETHILH